MVMMQPANGCDVCGAYSGEDVGVLRKNLERYGDEWLCFKCSKEVKKRDQDEPNS